MNIFLLGIILNSLIIVYSHGDSNQQVTLSCRAISETTRGPLGVTGTRGSKENIDLSANRRVPFSAKNCDVIHAHTYSTDGVFGIFTGDSLVQAYCEFDREGYNWMIFQRRFNGSVDFFLNWNDYVRGFGNKHGEFWLGLQALHEITSSGSYRLRVDLEDWEGNIIYAEYSSFSIGDSSSNYALRVNGYSGTAGDSLARHNGLQFSTKDRDNDVARVHCAVDWHGGWWYRHCGRSNLNGRYRNVGPGVRNGLIWWDWNNNFDYSMKRASMKIRPN